MEVVLSSCQGDEASYVLFSFFFNLAVSANVVIKHLCCSG